MTQHKMFYKPDHWTTIQYWCKRCDTRVTLMTDARFATRHKAVRLCPTCATPPAERPTQMTLFEEGVQGVSNTDRKA